MNRNAANRHRRHRQLLHRINLWAALVGGASTAVLCVLKLCGLIGLGWGICTAPTWGPLVGWLLTLCLVVMLGMISCVVEATETMAARAEDDRRKARRRRNQRRERRR